VCGLDGAQFGWQAGADVLGFLDHVAYMSVIIALQLYLPKVAEEKIHG
jgi:hypothetical protein